MNLISSVVAILMLVLFFAVSGSPGEIIEREMLYGFRVLSGFILIAGILRVIGVNYNRRKSGGKQAVSGVLFLLTASAFFTLFSLDGFTGTAPSKFVLRAFAIPLWTGFASLSGLALCAAVLRSAGFKKWESAVAVFTASFFLLALTLPENVFRFQAVPGKQIYFNDVASGLFEIVLTGGLRGFLLAFFCLVFADRIRVLLGKEKRTDEYTP
ncbi:hypothetical protein JXL83_00295 [candidate division WOR-3 bacterium]|nr:hypothetical protein [candidate division WOR-3 bacterium]